MVWATGPQYNPGAELTQISSGQAHYTMRLSQSRFSDFNIDLWDLTQGTGVSVAKLHSEKTTFISHI